MIFSCQHFTIGLDIMTFVYIQQSILLLYVPVVHYVPSCKDTAVLCSDVCTNGQFAFVGYFLILC